MEAPERGALTLVRLVGAVLLLWCLLEVGLYWGECASLKTQKNLATLPIEVLPIILRLIPALAGLAVLIKARAIADWISEKLDL